MTRWFQGSYFCGENKNETLETMKTNFWIAVCIMTVLSVPTLQAQSTEKPPEVQKLVYNAYIRLKPAFEAAYDRCPTIQRGILESVAYNYTRFISPEWPDTLDADPNTLPRTYSVMGLTLSGKGFFRENLRLVSELSGISKDEILKNDSMAIMAYALAFSSLQKKYNCFGSKLESYKPILIDLSEIPVDCDFALLSSLYVVYLVFYDGVLLHVGIPNYHVDFNVLFGEKSALLRQGNVLLDSLSEPKATSTVDYPSAVWNPAASCNYSARNGTQVNNVTIHYTSGTYAGAIAWFQNCAAKASAHYVIRSLDGQVTQMVRESDKAWHVGSANGYTIGIEHEAYGNVAAFFTDTMYASSAALVRDICARHAHINPHHVFYRDTLDDGTALNSGLHSLGGASACTQIRGHQHFPSQTHTDPGPYWNWNLYYKRINRNTVVDTVTASSGVFYDSGGPSGDYGNDERKLFLIHVPGADSIVLDFSEFNVERDYDFLWIYEGDNVFSRQIGRWNTQSPGHVAATGENMLVEFRSDCGGVAAGWKAQWTAFASPPNDTPPTTRILVSDTSWITRDFVARFQDADNDSLQYRFFQIMERERSIWSANPKAGFFADNFDTTLSCMGWQHDGHWCVQNHELKHRTVSSADSWVSLPFSGSIHDAYLFDLYLSMDSDTGKCTFWFHADEPISDPSVRLLAVTFDKQENSLMVWKKEGDSVCILKTVDHVYYAKGQKYLYRIVWDRISGKIMLFRHATLLAETIIPAMMSYQAGYMGFLSEGADVTVDNVRVYGSRADSVWVTVGSQVEKMIRKQADCGVSTCKLKSIVMNRAAKFSSLEEKPLLVDYTPPLPVRDVETRFRCESEAAGMCEGILQLSWVPARDDQSGIRNYYYYVSVGQLESRLKMIGNNCGMFTSIAKRIRVPVGSELRVAVQAEDQAGLKSRVITNNILF